MQQESCLSLNSQDLSSHNCPHTMRRLPNLQVRSTPFIQVALSHNGDSVEYLAIPDGAE